MYHDVAYKIEVLSFCMNQHYFVQACLVDLVSSLCLLLLRHVIDRQGALMFTQILNLLEQYASSILLMIYNSLSIRLGHT
jgi:hypothetical protein